MLDSVGASSSIATTDDITVNHTAVGVTKCLVSTLSCLGTILLVCLAQQLVNKCKYYVPRKMFLL